MGFIHTVFEFAQQAVGLGMSVQPIMAPRVFVLAMVCPPPPLLIAT
jgi:hypothetical protein